jgi:hypothetical protein
MRRVSSSKNQGDKNLIVIINLIYSVNLMHVGQMSLVAIVKDAVSSVGKRFLLKRMRDHPTVRILRCRLAHRKFRPNRWVVP